ncbi:AAA family ATPase [Corynebacterium sp. TAE3-ERU12]|uniref:McrB family protein n=1 Tax=Corynebacterium sp. TAE3-ERU12 TaxID=2849491 RepID=UPI001C43E8C1|nr:AAA family ATPase [Corynebacterium sp. TAE3-ERU12]MBV7294371.1 AAA family ATPase [Corynebacterium sp. TAE3-ERU12]
MGEIYGNFAGVEAFGRTLKDTCLIDGGSLLTDAEIWTPENFDELFHAYNEHPDNSRHSFDTKIVGQLADISNPARQLFAELYIVDLAAIGSMLAETKLRKINAVLNDCDPAVSLTGDNTPAKAGSIVDLFENGGVLDGGMGYNYGRYSQFEFLIDWGRWFMSLPRDQRVRCLENPDAIEGTIWGYAATNSSTIQAVLCYLIDPAAFFPCASKDLGQQIASHFRSYLTEDEAQLHDQRQLAIIVDRIREERTEDWNFWLDKDEWRTKKKASKSAAPSSPAELPITATAEPDPVDDEIDELACTGLPDFPAGIADRLLLHQDWLVKVHRLLSSRKQIIFQGPPGTGKTFLARKIALNLAGSADRVTMVQFHPAYSYEDFFEGFRPTADGTLQLRHGPLRRLADAALDNPDYPHFLVIDEINRGNLARIFGELYFLLEYRDQSIDLMYSAEPFTLPPNLYIIATMNTADRSIALIDSAMRRRFSFLTLHPDSEPTKSLLANWCADREADTIVVDLWSAINQTLATRDRERMLGPSYFMRTPDFDADYLLELWETDLEPQLSEIFYGQPDFVADIHREYCRHIELWTSAPAEQ